MTDVKSLASDQSWLWDKRGMRSSINKPEQFRELKTKLKVIKEIWIKMICLDKSDKKKKYVNKM